MLLYLYLAIEGIAHDAALMGYVLFRFGIEEAGVATSLGLTTNLAGRLLLGPLWIVYWRAIMLLYEFGYIESYTWPF